MIDFFDHVFRIMLGVLWAIAVVASITTIMRQSKQEETDEQPVYEYMHFRYSYRKMGECIEELNKLAAEGWEISVCAGEDSFNAYLILKREIPYNSKDNPS